MTERAATSLSLDHTAIITALESRPQGTNALDPTQGKVRDAHKI